MTLLASIGFIIIFLLICVGFAFVRSFAKARIRLITVAISAVAAIITALVLKDVVMGSSFMNDLVLPMLSELDLEDLGELIELSPTLAKAMLGFVAALITPVLCVAFFVLYCMISWVVYFIITLVRRRKLKAVNRHQGCPRRKACLFGLGQGLIILFILILPFSCYMDLFATAGEVLAQSELRETTDEEGAELMDTIIESVDDVNKSIPLQMFRYIGVKPVGDLMLSFRIDGEWIWVKEELVSVISLADSLASLSSGTDNYSVKQADALDKIADTLGGSNFLSAVTGELIYGATESVVNDQNDTTKPADPGKAEEENIIDPLMDEVVVILHNDAKNPAALKADIKTVAQMIRIFAENKVFENLEDSDKILSTLGAKSGVVESLITTLGSNESTKSLIPHVTNLGIRAIGDALEIPKNDEAVYDRFLSDVSKAIDEVSELDSDKQLEALTQKLADAFDVAGVTVEAATVEKYAADLKAAYVDNGGNAAKGDVRSFFANNAETQVNANGTPVVALSSKKLPAFMTNSNVVTMDDLLLNVKDATAKITAETLPKEAKAIASIFTAAAEMVGNETGEDADLTKLAASLGGILDSLNGSATYGQNRASDLFTAIFQSKSIRSSVGLTMLDATTMAKKAGGGNYTTTLKSVSKSVDLVASLKSDDGKMSDAELAKVIEDLNPQTAGMMEIYITPDRMVEMGTPEGKSESTAAVLTSMFSYMGNEDIEDYDAEAKALNQVMSMATAAKDDDSSKLFSSEGQDDGRLPTQSETIATMMNSQATIHALKENMVDENGEITDEDPFGVAIEDEQEAADFADAIYEYKTNNPNADEESLTLVAAAFGVAVQF